MFNVLCSTRTSGTVGSFANWPACPSACILGAALALLTLAPPAALGADGDSGKNRHLYGERERDGSEIALVATGLTNPRHIRFGPDGYLYVAEAGTGGDLLPNTPGCPPADNLFTAPPLHGYVAGFTGRISRILPNGTRETVVDGLPSSRDGFDDGYGPTDIVWRKGVMYVLLQGGGCSRGLPDDPAGIARINPDGSYTFVADISAFIRLNPPMVEPICGVEGDCEPDGVPHTMIADENWFYVMETNHNSLLRVDPDTGEITRIYDLSVQDPAPITIARKGNKFYIGAFDGVILSFTRRFGQVETVDEGYGGIVQIIPVGNSLYILETSSAETPFAPNNGSVIRRNRDGSREVIASGLNFPVGMVQTRDGKALLVSTVGFGVGTREGLGQILQIRLSRHHPGNDRYDDEDCGDDE
jgi:hypothetical protein